MIGKCWKKKRKSIGHVSWYDGEGREYNSKGGDWSKLVIQGIPSRPSKIIRIFLWRICISARV